jgi:hypothetical protein
MIQKIERRERKLDKHTVCRLFRRTNGGEMEIIGVGKRVC